MQNEKKGRLIWLSVYTMQHTADSLIQARRTWYFFVDWYPSAKYCTFLSSIVTVGGTVKLHPNMLAAGPSIKLELFQLFIDASYNDRLKDFKNSTHRVEQIDPSNLKLRQYIHNQFSKFSMIVAAPIL